MSITLTRQPRWADQQLHPEQRISREQALRLYTTNNAFVMFAEKEKGSIETGKLADFIVLDRDYLTCPIDEVAEIAVKQTFVAGQQVFASE
jgi:predicted amidohydrolase YtcJ